MAMKLFKTTVALNVTLLISQNKFTNITFQYLKSIVKFHKNRSLLLMFFTMAKSLYLLLI